MTTLCCCYCYENSDCCNYDHHHHSCYQYHDCYQFHSCCCYFFAPSLSQRQVRRAASTCNYMIRSFLELRQSGLKRLTLSSRALKPSQNNRRHRQNRANFFHRLKTAVRSDATPEADTEIWLAPTATDGAKLWRTSMFLVLAPSV